MRDMLFMILDTILTVVLTLVYLQLLQGLSKLGLFGTLKLALALQFIVMNAYFSVARTLTLVLHATLK